MAQPFETLACFWITITTRIYWNFVSNRNSIPIARLPYFDSQWPPFMPVKLYMTPKVLLIQQPTTHGHLFMNSLGSFNNWLYAMRVIKTVRVSLKNLESIWKSFPVFWTCPTKQPGPHRTYQVLTWMESFEICNPLIHCQPLHVERIVFCCFVSCYRVHHLAMTWRILWVFCLVFSCMVPGCHQEPDTPNQSKESKTILRADILPSLIESNLKSSVTFRADYKEAIAFVNSPEYSSLVSQSVSPVQYLMNGYDTSYKHLRLFLK